jgi:hypothetical protein
MEISKFKPIVTNRRKLLKSFAASNFQIREEGSRLNAATQNAIGFALSLLVDPSPGDAATKLNLKKVFASCREKFCSINGAPAGRLFDEGMRQERAIITAAMLAQAEPLRPKARRHLATAMVNRISPMV